MSQLAFQLFFKKTANKNFSFYLVIGVVIAALIALQQFSLGSYNNFNIFKASFSHLVQGQNLYIAYPQQYDDLFLYNPTFAVLFAPFAYLPQSFSMLLWAVISMLVYLVAVKQLPISKAEVLFLMALCLPDSINSLQHQQVNHINLGLMLLAFVCLRTQKPVLAALFTVLIFFIKVYPAAIGLCFVFFPEKRKYLVWCAIWFAVFFALPLLFVSFQNLAQQYHNWFVSLKNDRSMEENSTSLSLISINYQWLKNPVNPSVIQFCGLGFLMLPLLLKRSLLHIQKLQTLYLAAILLFVIVFNHAAESATYLLAVTGVGLWYVSSKKNPLDVLLLSLVILFTVLPVTDLVPSFIKKQFIQPYSIRAVPCVLVWMRIIYQLLTIKPDYGKAKI